MPKVRLCIFCMSGAAVAKLTVTMTMAETSVISTLKYWK
jgi:hypothetical protein